MSLLTVAQATSGLRVACNFDTAATDKVNGTSVTSSTITTSGTFTQNASSLTGAKSYDLSSSARAYVTWSDGTGNGTDSIIQEYVFKKSSAPGTGNYEHLGDLLGTSIYGDSFQVGIGPAGDIYLNAKNGSGTTTGVSSGGNYCDGNWHHVVASYMVAGGSTGLRLYIDGTLIATDTTIGNIGDSNKWNIGSFVSNTNTSPSSYFNGTMDFAAVYVQASYTNAQMDTLVSDHVASYSNGGYSAQASTATALMTTATPYSNTLTAGALGDAASYVFTLDSTITQVLGDAMTGGRTFSTPTNTATYRAGRSTTGGTGSWEIANTNTAGNEITFVESTTPNITHEKGLSIETVFYYPAYVATDAAGQSIFVKSWSGGGVEVKLNASAGNNYIEAGFSGPGYITHSTALVPGRWYHVVAQWDPSDDYTYLTVNDVTEVSASKNTGAGNHFDESTSFNLGADSGLSIDFVALYSSVYNGKFLSSAEIGHHYDTFEALRYIQQSDTVAATPMTATASIPTAISINATALTAFATIVGPSAVTAIRNKTITATALTASALLDPPAFTAGANHGATHMNASADMGQDSIPFILGIGRGNPMNANANITEPVVTSELGVLVKPQSLTASATLITPPAYKLITDDIWYSKLYLQHSITHGEQGYTAGASSAGAFLKLFDDVTANIGGANTNNLIVNLPRSIIIDNPRNTDTSTQYANATNEFQTATPTPVLEFGTFDDYERKAVRFRNIQFEATQDIYKGEGGYSLEFTFKSTKANQVIAQGRTQSFYAYQRATSSIGLLEGKLFASRLTQEIGGATIFAHPDNIGVISKPSYLTTAYGNKRIDDGAWHHIIIQYGFDGRVQFWIDGQLDIQFFADSKYARGAAIRPFVLGSNHSNPRWQSDFETSAWSYDAAFFVDSNDITEHYTASIKYEPIHAEPATATAEIGQASKGEGNRGRALMLYFWPTDAAQTGTPFGTGPYTSTESPGELTTLDYFTKPPQEYEGWDVFPVDITGKWVSDLVKIEAYGGTENIGQTNFIQYVSPYQNTKNAPYALVNKRRTFRDPLTDAPRYIDLINDIDLSKFDMIMFKNYPNDPNEKDAFSGSEVVDAYFNLRESKIFEDFVKSLRAAVDTGMSLMVANAQLALDLKIVDRVETVPDMDDNVGQGNYSDPYAPTQMFGVEGAAGLPTPPQYAEPLGWWDTWKNNRTRIVNTHPDITDYPALVKTQQAFWYSTDEFRWGGADRPFVKYEHKDALAVGDEFVISTTGIKADSNRAGYLATPFANVKAGKIITAFANTVRRGLDEIENPYRNYAQSIIIEPGDVLNGTQVGGKIYVNFTEEINKTQEQASIELISDYWVNYAYDNEAIDLNQRDEALAGDYNQDETPYWSLNGMHILQQTASQFTLDDGKDNKDGGVKSGIQKVRKIDKNGKLSFRNEPSGAVFFSSTYAWRYPMATFEMPSMPTRGFRWLSNREVIDGTVIRPQAFTTNAQMPGGIAIPDKDLSYNTQPMLASATIVETLNNSGNITKPALPLTATATIVKPGSTIAAEPMRANAGMFANSRPNVASEDQVVLYLMHVDPILYIREDVIK